MDVADAIMLTLFFLFGYATGYGRRARRASREEVKDTSKCSCTHVFSVHKKDGVCNASVRTTKYNSLGDDVGYNYSPCACVNYDGVPPGHVFLRDNN